MPPVETVVQPPVPVLLRWSVNVIGASAPFDVYVQVMARLPGAAGATAGVAGTAGTVGGVVAEAVLDQAEKPSALKARTR